AATWPNGRVDADFAGNLGRVVPGADRAGDLLVVHQRAVQPRAVALGQDRDQHVERRLVRVEARRPNPGEVQPLQLHPVFKAEAYLGVEPRRPALDARLRWAWR